VSITVKSRWLGAEGGHTHMAPITSTYHLNKYSVLNMT
jgi:hypothetical protein